MSFYKAKKVILVTEAVIMDEVIKLADKLGAHNYTAIRVAGKGRHGSRLSDDHEGMFSNVKLEFLTCDKTAHKLAEDLVAGIFLDYAGVVYIEDVEMIRIEKHL